MKRFLRAAKGAQTGKKIQINCNLIMSISLLKTNRSQAMIHAAKANNNLCGTAIFAHIHLGG